MAKSSQTAKPNELRIQIPEKVVRDQKRYPSEAIKVEDILKILEVPPNTVKQEYVTPAEQKKPTLYKKAEVTKKEKPPVVVAVQKNKIVAKYSKRKNPAEPELKESMPNPSRIVHQPKLKIPAKLTTSAEKKHMVIVETIVPIKLSASPVEAIQPPGNIFADTTQPVDLGLPTYFEPDEQCAEIPELVNVETHTSYYPEMVSMDTDESLIDLPESLFEAPVAETTSDQDILFEVESDCLNLTEIADIELGEKVTYPETIGYTPISVETVELFKAVIQKIGEVEPAKSEQVEAILKEVTCILGELEIETSDEYSSAEVNNTVSSEDLLTKKIEEVIWLLGIEVTKEQIKDIVALVVERKEIFKELIEKTPNERGTHEVLAYMTSMLSDIKHVLEPLHTLLGRIVLLASRRLEPELAA